MGQCFTSAMERKTRTVHEPEFSREAEPIGDLQIEVEIDSIKREKIQMYKVSHQSREM